MCRDSHDCGRNSGGMPWGSSRDDKGGREREKEIKKERERGGGKKVEWMNGRWKLTNMLSVSPMNETPVVSSQQSAQQWQSKQQANSNPLEWKHWITATIGSVQRLK